MSERWRAKRGSGAADGASLSRSPQRHGRSPRGGATMQHLQDIEVSRSPRPPVWQRRGPSRPAASTRTGLSAVTLEPLRPRAAHVVQLRSIAAVRQDGSDGPDNGHEIHCPFPHAIFPAPVLAGTFGQRMKLVGRYCEMCLAQSDGRREESGGREGCPDTPLAVSLQRAHRPRMRRCPAPHPR
jgi:hypothetical protein